MKNQIALIEMDNEDAERGEKNVPRNKVNYAKLLEGVQKVIKRGDYPKFLRMVNRIKKKMIIVLGITY